MPFTFSHPAAVIPFAKRKLILSAAIIGSMAPDFEYFLKLSTRSHYGHSFPGIFFFSLPVGLFVLWLYQSYIKKPVIALMPSGFQQRMANCTGRFEFFPVSRFIIILLSLFIGVLSHVGWDSLTHLDGFVVKHIDIFQENIKIMNFNYPIYRMLQQVSSIIGGLIIIFLVAQWYKKTPAKKIIFVKNISDKNKTLITAAIFISAFFFGVIYSPISFSLLDRFSYIRRITGITVANIISFLFIGFLIYSIIWNLRFAKYRKDWEE